MYLDYSDYTMVKDSKHFSLDKLINPDFYLWPGFFWVINDRLDKKRIYDQMKDMYEHGAKSIVIHAEPIELGREVTCYSMLDDITYLSKEYMEFVKYVSDKCKELGMHLWLYDEAGWPSGIACGQVFARNPKAFERKELTYYDFVIRKHEKSYIVPDGVVFAAIQRARRWEIYKPGETIDLREEDNVIRVFYIKINYNDQYNAPGLYDAPFANLFNRSATETFISITHERIKEYIGDRFGKNLFLSFTDEPGVSGISSKAIPWVDDFDSYFKSKYGYSIMEYIPYLLTEEQDGEDIKIKKVRIDLFDCCSKLLVERFLQPIQEWCIRNNLLSSGHLWEEDLRSYACGGAFHLLREYRAMDVPGVDFIFNQIIPGKRSPIYVKYASSIARQKGMPYTLTESFCVAGNGLTPAQMKWCTDQQYVRGANLMVIGCYPYSTREHLMSGERPHFGPVNPLWKYQDIFHGYVARLGYLMSRGQAECNVAVYINMRDIWAGKASREKAFYLHNVICRTLLENQIDFDFIDDDVLSGKEGKIKDGRLFVGKMKYDFIVVPETLWMGKEALEGLVLFANQGGTLLVVGEKVQSKGGEEPSLGKESPNIKYITYYDLGNQLEPLMELKPIDGTTKGIRAAKRVLDNVRIYFMFNEYDSKVKTKAIFNEKGQPIICEVETGRLMRTDSMTEGEKTRMELVFDPWESKVILFGVDYDENVKEMVGSLTGLHGSIELNSGWGMRPIKQFKAGLHDYEIVDRVNEEYIQVDLGDWGKYLGKYYSGEVEYVVEFNCLKKDTRAKALLELGEVRYACTVHLNGRFIGRKAWGPYSFRIDGMLKEGKNFITVKVTNTLANAILNPECEMIWDGKVNESGKPKGRVWDKGGLLNAKELEKDSIPSGLFGPVRIFLQVNQNSRVQGHENSRPQDKKII